mmetsp:Transcript_10163/g.30054  ORF Transcript_10163/g.30054 Transcript_10163/m.30054 type:complete len:317 (-) Transcript_10163:67-1017(-)
MLLLLASLAAATPSEALLHYRRLNNAAPSNFGARHNKQLQMRLNPSSFAGTDFTIVEFPRPALRRVPNAPIAIFDDRLEAKTQEMIGMMYQAKGVGLAAPQIDLNENVFVYNPSGDQNAKSMERVVCNPSITKYSTEVEVEEEGCLSLRSDSCAGQVARSVWVEVEYQNELGQKVRRRLKGFEARVFQHEYDHLKGILCYDRFPPEDREAVQAGIDKLLGLYTESDALTKPDSIQAQAMQPRPLSAKKMPPLQPEAEEEAPIVERQKATKSKSGFGVKAGGFGAGGGSGKKAKKTKEKKKKVKVRNGAFSNNPTFK